MIPKRRVRILHDGDDFANDTADTELNMITPSSEVDADISEHQDNETNRTPTETSKSEYKSLIPFCVVVGTGTLLSQTISVYLSTQITVLEKVFGLSSVKSGLLLSANDMGFVVTILFASHFLKNYNIPRVLAVCIFIFGVSSVLTSVPHFILDESDPPKRVSLDNSTTNDEYMCVPGLQLNISGTNQKCSGYTSGKPSSALGGNQWVVVLISAMMAIQGIAKSPRLPLSSLYLDRNTEKEKTGFYIGILFTFIVFGPFIATLGGAAFNKIPVNLKETLLTSDDPRWIGAWWLGFVIFGACAILISIPMFFLPASLSKDADIRCAQPAEHADSSCIDSSNVRTFIKTIKDMPKSIFRVLRSPIYTCNMLSALFTMFAFASLVIFGPKYIINQFRIPTYQGNMILGGKALVCTVTGTFFGGLITRRLRLGVFGCVKMLLICRCLALICKSFHFLLGCDNPPIIGLDTSASVVQNLICDCSMTNFLPVCADGQTYFSPCHAGCTAEVEGVYSNCTAVTADDPLSGQVQSGICDTGCTFLIPFVILDSISALLASMSISPSYVTLIRSVDEKDRAMAVGISSFLMSLLVFVPAPIVIGTVFDSVCRVWSSACSKGGSCALYDIKDMRIRMVAICIGFLTIGLIWSSFTYLFAKKREAEDNAVLLDVDGRHVNSVPGDTVSKTDY